MRSFSTTQPLPEPTRPDRRARLSQTTLGYWDCGQGDSLLRTHTVLANAAPVILLHSGVQSALAWGPQRNSLSRRGLRLIGYSRRGYAGSDPVNPDRPGVAADDLYDLLDHLEIESAHLVALAHGGFFALDFALNWPDRVRSLTIASSMMGISEPDYQEMLDRLRPPCFEELSHELKELGPSYRASNPHGARIWQALAAQARSGIIASQEVTSPISWARLQHLRCRALIMTGDADLYTPPAVLRFQQTYIPHARSIVIRESGHCPNWEQPGAFNHHVYTFIQETERLRCLASADRTLNNETALGDRKNRQ